MTLRVNPLKIAQFKQGAQRLAKAHDNLPRRRIGRVNQGVGNTVMNVLSLLWHFIKK